MSDPPVKIGETAIGDAIVEEIAPCDDDICRPYANKEGGENLAGLISGNEWLKMMILTPVPA